ncbi:hypothetical protein F0562_013552 [Nyssa sinensis]|uniref:Uncharacterized protein n=1 Tax=Nyssa sinensis TaxID=561372 RepID=A0A5J4ZNM4_9ASTE|nr:hypothetical protein F0562_013552 [Nyssa sinensis]
MHSLKSCSIKDLNLKETELRPGLPGSESPERKAGLGIEAQEEHGKHALAVLIATAAAADAAVAAVHAATEVVRLTAVPQSQHESVNKDELLQMVRFGAKMVFSSKDSTITDEDIDRIFAKGEEATAELDAKMKKFTEDAIKFKMDDTADLYDFDDKKDENKLDFKKIVIIRNLSTSSKQCAKVVRQDQKSLESQIAGYCFVDFAGIRLQQKSWGLPVYKKHYPPALHDEVWRLDTIAKDGALHKKLIKDEITTVEDFLRVLVRDPQRLRNILGSGMSNRMWENTVEHAKTCVLGGKLYVYYSDESQSSGAAFNHIYELNGLIADGHFLPLESLNQNQKISVDSLVKRAYENWNEVVEYDSRVLNSLSNKMLENDDMQRLLKTFNMGGVGVGSAFGHSDEACYSHNVPYEHQMDRTYGQERGRSSGKAVVGWLKLKAALRWGIFIRKRAAERRAQLVDILQII